MNSKETIEVFIRFENNRTACICKRSNRKCQNPECEPEIVERDKFRDAADLFYQNKYGKSYKV